MKAGSKIYRRGMRLVFREDTGNWCCAAYQMPELGKAGPQSQLKEDCILRMWLTWHSPLKAGSTHLGGTK